MKEKQHSSRLQFTAAIHGINQLQILWSFVLFALFGDRIWYNKIHTIYLSNTAEQPTDNALYP